MITILTVMGMQKGGGTDPPQPGLPTPPPEPTSREGLVREGFIGPEVDPVDLVQDAAGVVVAILETDRENLGAHLERALAVAVLPAREANGDGHLGRGVLTRRLAGGWGRSS
jgi:hypothetical protein